jgi:hypothetical protein
MYQSIDLIDRKIASSKSWETFESQEARDAHLRKLTTKRATLVKSALVLSNQGVRCDPQFLPRSFAEPTPELAVPDTAISPATEEEITSKPARVRRKRS